MHLLLDLQILQSRSRDHDAGRHARGLAAALLSAPHGETSVLLNLALEDTFDAARAWVDQRDPPPRLRAFHGLRSAGGREAADEARIRIDAALYNACVASLGVELVLAAAPFDGFDDASSSGWDAPVAAGAPARAAAVYDLGLFDGAQREAGPEREAWSRRRLAALSGADLLLTPSDHMSRAVANRLGIAPERVVNVGFDADPVFRAQPLSRDEQAALKQRHGIARPFVMQAGAFGLDKNTGTLVRAFGGLSPEAREGHELVLAGQASDSEVAQLRAVAREAGFDPARVIFTGPIAEEDVAKLYALARVVVQPALAEPCGLTLLEPMRCGATVLGADSASLAEVVGNQHFLFDPAEPWELAGRLGHILADDAFRAWAVANVAAQERRFSWTLAASRAREAFAEALAPRASNAKSEPPQRRRFVLVPPRDLKSFRLAPVRAAINALATVGDVVLAAPFKASLAIGVNGVSVADPDGVSASSNQCVIVIGTAAGLDEGQRAVLARMPAVAFLPEHQPPGSPSAEARYHAGGYAALVAARSGDVSLSPDALLAAWPNVLGVIDDPAKLVDGIEAIHAANPLAHIAELLDQLGAIEPRDRDAVTAAVADNHAAPRGPRLFVDLSELAVRGDAKSGIQRVVRGILQHLLLAPSAPRVEPIYRDGDIYRYARAFTCRFLGLESLGLGDAVVDFGPSDVFVGLDLDATISPGAVKLLKFHSRRGMRLVFVAYDMLPVFRPDWFPEGIAAPFGAWIRIVSELADRLVAISRATANDAMTVMDRLQPARNRPLETTWWHLGSDLAGSAPSTGIAPAHAATLARLRGRTIFLAVGTLEPRKGVEQLLDAAEELWREQDIALVLIGKNGWKVDRLMSRIAQHPELGARLFWFDSVSDELLERLYAMSTALVVPSEAEGFGLPLVEAARHGTPVIARNLDVFREVAGEGAFYFDAENGAGLAAALRVWLDLHAKREAPDPRRIATLTWRASTGRFVDAVLRPDPYRSWLPR
jgi:glycosyltransferase involved in cell wall biosynthesis